MVNQTKSLSLNRKNIKKELTNYVNSIKSIKLRAPQGDILRFSYFLKREKLDSGRYKRSSVFEASSLILSNLVILLGVHKLLTNPMIGNIELPFTEYKVHMDREGGHDLEAISGNHRLVGEAFNVSPSLFKFKRAYEARKLKGTKANYRLIIFNSDAVKNKDHYLKKSTKPMLYLPVDVPKSLHEISNSV